MSLVLSLLQAIVKVDGDAMVIHAGDKPYVVSPTGQVELASRGLTLEAVNGIVGQLLPIELQNALDEFGAVQYELPPAPEFPGEHFTVVAARGGDDVWVEMRRRRVVDDDRVPEEFFGSASASPAPQAPQQRVVPEQTAQPVALPFAPQPAAATLAVPPVASAPMSKPVAVAQHCNEGTSALGSTGATDTRQGFNADEDLLIPDEAQLWPAHTQPEAIGKPRAHGSDEEFEIDVDMDTGEPEPAAASIWERPTLPTPRVEAMPTIVNAVPAAT